MNHILIRRANASRSLQRI